MRGCQNPAYQLMVLTRSWFLDVFHCFNLHMQFVCCLLGDKLTVMFGKLDFCYMYYMYLNWLVKILPMFVLMWSVQINMRQWMVETRQHVLMVTDLLLLLLISCSPVADLKQAHSLMEKSQIWRSIDCVLCCRVCIFTNLVPDPKQTLVWWSVNLMSSC